MTSQKREGDGQKRLMIKRLLCQESGCNTLSPPLAKEALGQKVGYSNAV